MTADLLETVLRLNLALAGAIAFVMLLRTPVRLWFGARLAYALWLIPPLAALATLLPKQPEIVRVVANAPAVMPVAAHAPSTPIEAALFETLTSPDAQSISQTFADNLTPALSLLWVIGAALSLCVLALRQWRYSRVLGRLTLQADEDGARVYRAATSAAGPAVIGVLRPKIVTPADFDRRYTADERRAVIAHERAHMRHGDPTVNAFAAALQSLCWFNPAVYFGVQALRVDQELACDAAVLARAQGLRRTYAEAMLKSQIGDVAPLGCAWPPASIDVLKERISMLKSNLPSKRQAALGAGAVALATIAACGVAWTAQPPRTITIVEHASVEGLEGGADSERPSGRDQLALRERIRLAIDDARRQIDSERLEMLAQRDAIMAQRAEIADHRAEARELQRQAMEVAREAIEQARRDVAEETAALALEGEDPQALELGREAQGLAAQALALAARAMSEGEIDPAEEAQIEAEMERRAVRISELAMRVGAEASERARIEVERAHRQMARPPEPALAPRAPEAPRAVAPIDTPRAPAAPLATPEAPEAPRAPVAPY